MDFLRKGRAQRGIVLQCIIHFLMDFLREDRAQRPATRRKVRVLLVYKIQTPAIRKNCVSGPNENSQKAN